MATDSDLLKFDIALETGSADETGPGDSDIEDLSSESDQDTEIPKDYWFGKKYFGCIIARDLMHRTSLHETVTSIDSKLEAVMRCYPYRQCLEYLQSEGVPTPEYSLLKDERDTCQTLLALTGTIIRKGTSKEKDLLLSAIRNSATAKPSVDRQELDDTISRLKIDEENILQDEKLSHGKGLKNAALAPYSMALKEFGDAQDTVPVYSTQTVSLDPPKFRAIVSFKDFTFEGMARTKKQAKHCAAREACKYLGVKTS